MARAIKRTARGVTAVDAEVGARIRAIRSNQGMSQEQLGAKLGISFQQVQKYEKGVNRLSLARAVQLASILNTSVDELLGSKADPLDIVRFDAKTYALAGSLTRLEGISSKAASQFRLLIDDICDILERRKKKTPT